VIRHGVDGLLFSSGEASLMADSLNTLLSNQALREEMGKRARERFLEVFETSAALNAQVQWLESL